MASSNNTSDQPSFVGMTMAVTHMPEMLGFYSNVFQIDFTEKEMFDSKLYSAKWGGLNLLFCPANIAQNTAKQNRHQFDFLVPDLAKLIKIAKQCGGTKMGEVVKEGSYESCGIYDPDNNSILFKERKD